MGIKTFILQEVTVSARKLTFVVLYVLVMTGSKEDPTAARQLANTSIGVSIAGIIVGIIVACIFGVMILYRLEPSVRSFEAFIVSQILRQQDMYEVLVRIPHFKQMDYLHLRCDVDSRYSNASYSCIRLIISCTLMALTDIENGIF